MQNKMEAVNEVEKKPIAPTLRKMNVGDVEEFPVERYTSVNSAIQTVEYKKESEFSMRKEGDVVYVTRVK